MPTGNYTRPSLNRKPLVEEKPEEAPKFQFRGVHLPAEVILQLTEKKLNRTDLLVLILVEALVTPRGRGCWASNKYIARSIGVHFQNVSQSIQKLSDPEYGLLVVTTENGVRYLETAWSRTGNEGRQVGKRKHLGGVSENTYPLPYKGIELEGGSETDPHPPADKPSLNGHHKNGHHKNGRSILTPPPVKDQAYEDARSFREALRGHKIHVDDTLPGCADNLRRLFKRYPEARDVFLWFRDNCGQEGRDQHGLPKICSGVQFCKRYEWIKDKHEKARTKAEHGEGRWVTFKIRKIVTERTGKNTSRQYGRVETVRRFLKGSWAVNEYGGRYWDGEDIKNLVYPEEGEYYAGKE